MSQRADRKGRKVRTRNFFMEAQRKFERKLIIRGTAIDKVDVNARTKIKVRDIGWTIGGFGNDKRLLLRVKEADIIST